MGVGVGVAVGVRRKTRPPPLATICPASLIARVSVRVRPSVRSTRVLRSVTVPLLKRVARWLPVVDDICVADRLPRVVDVVGIAAESVQSAKVGHGAIAEEGGVGSAAGS